MYIHVFVWFATFYQALWLLPPGGWQEASAVVILSCSVHANTQSAPFCRPTHLTPLNTWGHKQAVPKFTREDFRFYANSGALNGMRGHLEEDFLHKSCKQQPGSKVTSWFIAAELFLFFCSQVSFYFVELTTKVVSWHLTCISWIHLVYSVLYEQHLAPVVWKYWIGGHLPWLDRDMSFQENFSSC